MYIYKYIDMIFVCVCFCVFLFEYYISVVDVRYAHTRTPNFVYHGVSRCAFAYVYPWCMRDAHVHTYSISGIPNFSVIVSFFLRFPHAFWYFFLLLTFPPQFSGKFGSQFFHCF